MTKEKITLYRPIADGVEKVTYTRDLAKEPIVMQDYLNSVLFETVRTRVVDDMVNGTVDKDGIEQLVKAQMQFIVDFFHGQFTVDDAMKGLSPTILTDTDNNSFTRWSNLSQSFELPTDKTKKKTASKK